VEEGSLSEAEDDGAVLPGLESGAETCQSARQVPGKGLGVGQQGFGRGPAIGWVEPANALPGSEKGTGDQVLRVVPDPPLAKLCHGVGIPCPHSRLKQGLELEHVVARGAWLAVDIPRQDDEKKSLRPTGHGKVPTAVWANQRLPV
jgi:hypothetical protein